MLRTATTLVATAGRLANRLRRREDGVSAVEFGLLAPVLAVMLLGSIEMTAAITSANRSTSVADTIAEMVSRVDHTVTDDELRNFAMNAALIDTDIIQYAKRSGKPIDRAFKLTVTSVQFEPKVLSCLLLKCQFDAKVVFSYSLNGTARKCGNLKKSDAKQTMKTLPSGVFGPGSLVVVDVETFHAPIMPVQLGAEVSFKRTAFFRPRTVARVNHSKNCPSFRGGNDDDD